MVRLVAADQRRLTDAYLAGSAEDGQVQSAAGAVRLAGRWAASVDMTDAAEPAASKRRPALHLVHLASRDFPLPEAAAQSAEAAQFYPTAAVATRPAESASPAQQTCRARSALRFSL